MIVAIVDYGSGNLHSAHKALERASRESGQPADIIVTAEPEVVARADRVVLPGVGAFADCRRGLDAIPGMLEAMEEAVYKRGQPFLGVCVGMQLLATRGLEHEVSAGLDWIPGEVKPIQAPAPLKIPHMGWNNLTWPRPHPLLEGIASESHVYFVHSYQIYLDNPDFAIASTDYGGWIPAIVARDNIAGAQFHPEKSQAVGLRFLHNFLMWRP